MELLLTVVVSLNREAAALEDHFFIAAVRKRKFF